MLIKTEGSVLGLKDMYNGVGWKYLTKGKTYTIKCGKIKDDGHVFLCVEELIRRGLVQEILV
jgi:hypothetical protein